MRSVSKGNYEKLNLIFEACLNDIKTNVYKENQIEQILFERIEDYLLCGLNSKEIHELDFKSTNKTSKKLLVDGDEVFCTLEQNNFSKSCFMCSWCFIFYEHNKNPCVRKIVSNNKHSNNFEPSNKVHIYCSYGDECAFKSLKLPTKFICKYRELLKFSMKYFENVGRNCKTPICYGPASKGVLENNIQYCVCLFYKGHDNNSFIEFLLTTCMTIDDSTLLKYEDNILAKGFEMILFTNQEQKAYQLTENINMHIMYNKKSHLFSCEYFNIDIFIRMNISHLLMKFINSFGRKSFEICQVRNNVIFNEGLHLTNQLSNRNYWNLFYRHYAFNILFTGVDTEEGRQGLYEFLISNSNQIHQNYVDDNSLVYFADIEEHLIELRIMNYLFLHGNYMSHILRIYTDFLNGPDFNSFIIKNDKTLWKRKFCKICTIVERLEIFMEDITMNSDLKQIDAQIVQIAVNFFHFCKSFDEASIFSFDKYSFLNNNGTEILDDFLSRIRSLQYNIIYVLSRSLNKFSFVVDKFINVIDYDFTGRIYQYSLSGIDYNQLSLVNIIKNSFKSDSLFLTRRCMLNFFIEISKNYYLKANFFRFFENSYVFYMLFLPLLEPLMNLNDYIYSQEELDEIENSSGKFKYLILDNLHLIQICITFMEPSTVIRTIFSSIYSYFPSLCSSQNDQKLKNIFAKSPNYFKTLQLMYNCFTETISFDTNNYNFILAERFILNTINYGKISFQNLKDRIISYRICINTSQIMVILEKIAKCELENDENVYYIKSEYKSKINRFWISLEYSEITDMSENHSQNILSNFEGSSIAVNEYMLNALSFLNSTEFFLVNVCLLKKFGILNMNTLENELEIEISLEFLSLIFKRLLDSNQYELILWVSNFLKALNIDSKNCVFHIFGNDNQVYSNKIKILKNKSKDLFNEIIQRYNIFTNIIGHP